MASQREPGIPQPGTAAEWERDKEGIKAELRKQATISGVNAARNENALRYG
jgi:cytochrome c5